MTKARDLANIISGGFTESDIPALATAKITSGTFVDARIPNLNTSKLTAGTLADARIPNLNASKINAGTIATARLGSGTASSSTFLRGDGSYATLPVGGKILQAVSNSTSSETTNASTNYASSGLAVAITPSASSSKILVLVGSNFRVAGDGSASNVNREGKVAIFRGSVSGTLLQQQIIGITNISATSSSGVQSVNSISFAYLDSPSTTNATTYTVGISGLNNGDAQAQPFNFGSSIVLLEVGA